MRDFFNWSFPLARFSGILVRVHLLYPLIAIGLILRAGADKAAPPGFWVEPLILTLMLLVIVILHEFGHCFGARSVDGDASEVLIWPLGGLAFVDVPPNPRAHFITTAAGPAGNLVLWWLVAAALVPMGFIPPLNPLGVQGVAQMELHNWREGVNYGSRFAPGDLYYRDPDGTAHVVTPKETASRDGRLVLDRDPETPIQTSTLAWWQVRLAQFFWLNWFLFCFNVFLPGFPLDGGRLLQSIVWARSDYRQGTLAAIYGGYGVAGLLFVFALAYNETLALFIALFVGLTSYQEYFKLQHAMEDSPFGYDFSAGYTSLERDEERPRPRRQNFFQRWLQQRAARRLQKEIEQREYEDRRMDELLDKVHRLGKESLTTEERRFMERVSNRFRNR